MKNRVVKEWIKKAECDFESASILLKSKKKTISDTAAFHCQQSAEKYLKAFLTFHRKKFPKTHDLNQLIDLCNTIDGSFELIRDLVKYLNPYAVEFRYPGDEASLKEAKNL